VRKSRQAREAREEAAHEDPPEAQDEPTPRPAKRTPKKDRALQEKAATVPHDAGNEQVVIAAAIVSPKERARLVRIFLPEHFYGAGHAAIWAMLGELERRNLTYDPATARQLSNGEIKTDYLDLLIAERPAVPPNLAFHVEAMHLDKKRIECARGPLAELLEFLHDPTTDPDELRRVAKRIGASFDGGGSLRYLRDTDAVFANAVKRKQERRERFKRGELCYPYGLPGLDVAENGKPRLVPGMAPKQMTLVVGESGSGKTTFTNQVVLAQINQGKRVLHGAWEQDGEENLEMLAAYSLGMLRYGLWTGDMDDEADELHTAEMDRLRPSIKFFELPFDRTRNRKTKILNETNLDVIHEHVERGGCDVAIFDLFAKALVETKPEDEKRALDRMLGIAKDTDTHLILLHHLNKADLKDRPDRRPTREAIKGSTAWVDAFDTIFGLYIPDKWKPMVHSNTMEVHVLKQRYGVWPLAVEFDYDATTGIVSNGRSFDYSQHEDDREDSLSAFLNEERNDKGGRKRGR
jgi:KaiC/GvpD/RAD55 family RecA-like ATPase